MSSIPWYTQQSPPKATNVLSFVSRTHSMRSVSYTNFRHLKLMARLKSLRYCVPHSQWAPTPRSTLSSPSPPQPRSHSVSQWGSAPSSSASATAVFPSTSSSSANRRARRARCSRASLAGPRQRSRARSRSTRKGWLPTSRGGVGRGQVSSARRHHHGSALSSGFSSDV